MLAIDKLENTKHLLKKHYEDYDIISSVSCVLEDIMDENTIIINIGTDRVIFDVIAPYIGTCLRNKRCSIPIYGTISNPIHAKNLKEQLHKIKIKHPYSKIIAIDACAGDGMIGDIIIENNPRVGKDLPPVGDYSIKIVTNIITDPLCILNHYSDSIRLNDIMKIGKVVEKSILKTINIKKLNNKEVALTNYCSERL
jgi:putative sporulation protein YyaC